MPRWASTAWRAAATFCIRKQVKRYQSDVAAFDLFGQRLDQFRHLFEVRVDGERLAERVERAFLVADVLHDHAEAGQRAEMAGIPGQDLTHVAQRKGINDLLLKIRRTPVPR